MSQAITIKFEGSGPERLRQLVDGLESAGLKRMNEFVATEGRVEVKKHLLTASRSRHKSATRLGANPTGHLGLAAESVAGYADEKGATVSVTSPGFNRVDGPLEIKPVNGTWLTIPVHALAYGRRVSETENAIGQRLFRPGKKGAKKRVLMMMEDDGAMTPLYALCKKVTLSQDRGLLPTDEEFNRIGLKGINNYVSALLRRGAKS